MHALVDALGTLRHVVDGIGPDDLRRPTPCDHLDVGDVLAHVIGWQQLFAAALEDTELPWDGDSPTYRVSDTVRDDLDASTALLVAALDASDEDVVLPYRGTTPRDTLAVEITAETVLHTWDVAQAVGRTIAYPSRVVMTASRGLTLLKARSFGPEAFAPERLERTSDPLLRLVRRSGRGPWKPS